MEAKITALLSLLGVTLLAHALLLQPPRATVVFTDRFLSALRFDGRQLVNRRNMILLCHAILLVILNDAGLLAAPARRRCSAATATGSDDACSEAKPEPKDIVEMRRSSTAAAGASDANSPTVAVKRERRRTPSPDKTTSRLRRVKPSSSGPAHKEYPVVRDVDPADKQSSGRYFFDQQGDGTEIVAVEDKIACLHSAPVAHDKRSRGEMARQETEPDCGDDVDEMNKKFEEFIASMRRKMQLESRQLVKV